MEVLGARGGRGIVMWCPDNREDIGRLCGGIAKAGSQGVQGQISLVIPLEPRPGCHQVGQFMDTWSHELLQDRWAPWTTDIRFSREPMKIVVSGLHAPMHQVKSLCIVTLSTAGGERRRSMMQTTGTLGAGRDADLLIVDVREEDEIPADIVEA